MSEVSQAPEVATLDVPIDQWTQPFWDAAASGELKLPACAECGRFRWPPGPFCPECHAQATEWHNAGPARIYSFTVVREASRREGEPAKLLVPALVEFPAADGVRLLGAIADAPVAALRIGSELTIDWMKTANVQVPLFRLKG